MWALTPTTTGPQACVGDTFHGLTVSDTVAATQTRIQVSGDIFTPDWSGSTQPGILMLEGPAGTLAGNAFSATWSYCVLYADSITLKADWTWTGTLSADQKSFTSTLRETLTEADGNQLFACASISHPMSACTAPGLSWQVDGVRQ